MIPIKGKTIDYSYCGRIAVVLEDGKEELRRIRSVERITDSSALYVPETSKDEMVITLLGDSAPHIVKVRKVK